MLDHIVFMFFSFPGASAMLDTPTLRYWTVAIHTALFVLVVTRRTTHALQCIEMFPSLATVSAFILYYIFSIYEEFMGREFQYNLKSLCIYHLLIHIAHIVTQIIN